MREWFFENIYTNIFTLVTVVLSGIISWIITVVYFMKNNRISAINVIIRPIYDILWEPYTKENYHKMVDVLLRYEMKYLNNKERKTIFKLKESYKEFVCSDGIWYYNEGEVYSSVVLGYFWDVFKKNGLNKDVVPCICGDEIVYEPIMGKKDYEEVLRDIFNHYPLEHYRERCQERIKEVLLEYYSEYGYDKEIHFFDDISLKDLLDQSSEKKERDRLRDRLLKDRKAYSSLKSVKEIVTQINKIRDLD